MPGSKIGVGRLFPMGVLSWARRSVNSLQSCLQGREKGKEKERRVGVRLVQQFSVTTKGQVQAKVIPNMGWDFSGTILSPSHGEPAHPAQNDALQGMTPVLEIQISPAATGMLLKHCENPALSGGFRKSKSERETCPGSALILLEA